MGKQAGLQAIIDVIDKRTNEIATLLHQMIKNLDLCLANWTEPSISAPNDNILLTKGIPDPTDEEMIWRERKRRQVIILGVKEPKASTQAQRESKDRESLAIILDSTKAGIKHDEIKFVRRVGKAESSKDRPICVGFYDEYTKDHLLRFAKNLKDTGQKDVKILADLTRVQRQNFKDQLDLAKKKNAVKEDLEKGLEWRVVGPRGATRLSKVKVQHC